jgi:hypothetical protein
MFVVFSVLLRSCVEHSSKWAALASAAAGREGVIRMLAQVRTTIRIGCARGSMTSMRGGGYASAPA